MTTLRWTSSDLELLPDDGKRYEIIDGDLHVSRQPQFLHQVTCSRICAALDEWSLEHEYGWAAVAPGVIFAEDEDIAPDVIWASEELIVSSLAKDGKLYSAPEIAVEVLSPGIVNERRDKDVKLKLYARRGVLEYWIFDWPLRLAEIYRRDGGALVLVQTLTLAAQDSVETPILPGFSLPLSRVFARFPVS